MTTRLEISPSLSLALALSLLGACSKCHAEGSEEHHAEHPIVVTSATTMEVPIERHYVSQIHAQRRVEVRALNEGYLQEVAVQEGQAVHQGQLLFKILPVVYRASLETDRAELRLAEINLRNTQRLKEQGVVSDQELARAIAERDRARARFERAMAEYRFTRIVAPFDGIVDRQLMQLGSLVEEGDVLTTISDISLMWVYFNVPEADYLHFMSVPGARDPAAPHRLQLPDATIRLRLANGDLYEHSASTTLTVESEFDPSTGNIRFRADFPNPDLILRHGQTGTVVITQKLPDALVIPQRATFEILDRQYVMVVDDDEVAHQRQIRVAHELEDIFVIADGLSVGERYVLEGVRQVHDGQELHEIEERPAEEVLSNLKFHAE